MTSAPVEPDTVSTRTRILDAAERIVSSSGAGHLTLDAVVQQSGLSKGGLLYHFRSKEALLQGMMDRHSELFEYSLLEALGRHGSSLGGYVRAHLETAVDAPSPQPEVGQALLAAAAANPRMLDQPRRARMERLRAMASKSGDFDLALVAMYAISGIVLSELLQLDALSAEHRARLIAKLDELASQCSPAAANDAEARR